MIKNKKIICRNCYRDLPISDFNMRHGTPSINCKVCGKRLYTQRKRFRKIGKCVIKHRAVMEIELGRKLESIEFVHHCDGNRSNNNINNLFLTDRKEHGTITRINNLNNKYEHKNLNKRDLVFIFGNRERELNVLSILW